MRSIQPQLLEYVPVNMYDDMRRYDEAKYIGYLGHFARKCQNLGVPHKTMFGQGDFFGNVICSAAKNHKVDCLIVGRRQMGGFKRFFVGSTSKYCLENAPCNVVVVKYEDGEPQHHPEKYEVRVVRTEEHEAARPDHNMDEAQHESQHHQEVDQSQEDLIHHEPRLGYEELKERHPSSAVKENFPRPSAQFKSELNKNITIMAEEEERMRRVKLEKVSEIPHRNPLTQILTESLKEYR